MAMEAQGRLTTASAVIIMVNYVLSAGVLTLPRTTVQAGGTADVWISVIAGALLSIAAGFFIVKLSQRFPGQTFFQYARLIVGKPLGGLLGLLVCGYFLCVSSFEMRSAQEITGFFLLEGTPFWAIAAIFMWVALYLCRGGLDALSRMCRLSVPITWSVFLLVCLLSMEIFDLNNLRPVLGEGPGPVWKAVKPTALTYTAGEYLLILTACMTKPKKAVKVLVIGTLITMLFYLFAVVLSIGAFSADGVVTRTWPFIDLIRSFEVNYLVFERFESLLLAIWIMQIFCTFSLAFYGAALGVSQIMNKRIEYCLFLLLPLIYLLSEAPHNINGLFAFGTAIGNGSMLLFGLMPLPLLIIAYFRRAGS